VFAVSSANLVGKPFSYCKEIVLIGMTARQTIARRFMQFETSIRGNKGHGPGMRMRTKYRDYDKLTKLLYVAIARFDKDQRTVETQCIDHYKTLFGHKPEFNTKVWPKHLEEEGSLFPFRCVFDDKIAAEEFIARVTKLFDRPFQLVALGDATFKVAEAHGAAPRSGTRRTATSVIDNYVGSQVRLTDTRGETYTGTLTKAVISVVVYRVEGEKGTPIPVQTHEIAKIGRLSE